MPQLTLTDKINPLPNNTQLDRHSHLKRSISGVYNQHFPFARGPVRVPLRRITDNKLVTSNNAIISNNKSKSVPRVRQTLKQSLLNDYGVNINSHLK